MQTGLNLVDLAKKIEANKQLKHDLIAETAAVRMEIDADGRPGLLIPDQGTFPIMPVAHDQISGRLNIPARYYGRMQTEAPDLLAANVNRWFVENSEKRMIRTLGGDVRAFLSNRYQRIENEEIASVVLPVLADIPEVSFVSAEITYRRMYIQAVTPRLQGEVRVGDVVQAGVIISNSEVGLGSVTIAPMVYRLACLNGMITSDSRFTARHVGARIDNTEALWSDEAKRADDRAVLLKVRDVVRAAVSEVTFSDTLDRMRGLTQIRVKGDPAAAVEVLAKKVGATEDERGGILRALIEGGDLSGWGLINAITHQAHTAKNYDRCVEFEVMGGQLLNLPKKEWAEILEAA